MRMFTRMNAGDFYGLSLETGQGLIGGLRKCEELAEMTV
jgi:hypothetical protein